MTKSEIIRLLIGVGEHVESGLVELPTAYAKFEHK
jgi:hypothetical protein